MRDSKPQAEAMARPWMLDSNGFVYSEPNYKPAPFVDLDGVSHPDHMDGLVALVYGPDANAALIVRAVNLHEEMVAALKAAADWIPYLKSGKHDPIAQAILAVLAKAGRE